MNDEESAKQELPFNNLYLNAGLVNGLNQWWMYLSTILFVMFGYLVFGSIITVPLYTKAIQRGISPEDIQANNNIVFNSELLGIDRNVILLIQFGLFVFAAIGFVTGIKRFHKKTITSVFTGYERFRFKRFWLAFGVWGSLLALAVMVSYLTSPEDFEINFNAGGFLISLVILFIFMPIQTGIEEVVFRGYLLQGFSQIFKNGIIPLFITSLLFGLAHMSNPEVREYGWQIMLTYYVCFALFMGGLTLLDEGLELAFGIHFANNLISSILVTSPHSVIKTYSLFNAKSEDPGSEIILWFCMAIVTFIIFWLIYRWKNFNLIIK